MRFSSSGVVLGVMAVLLCGGTGHAQSQGSRPIEFSEPREQSGQTTNEQGFGSDRRRLNSLEDRLSKTFNFFGSGDSMGGAPAPQPPRRAPVSIQRSKSKSLFETEDKLDPSDPRARLRRLLESDALTDESLEPDQWDSPEQSEPDLLESLKSDDWLAKGMMDETFWGMPLEVEEKSSERSPWEAPQEPDGPSFGPLADVDFRPQLEGFLGRNIGNRSPFGTPASGTSSFSAADGFELGRPLRAAMAARRDDYRALLGFAANPVPGQTAATGNPAQMSSSYPPPAAASTTFRSESRRSLYPLAASDRTSLYPTAPTAPQKPSVFDPIEIEEPVSRDSPASAVLNDPFYQQPRRQF